MLYTVLWSDVSRVILRPRLPLFLARTLKRLGEPGNEATTYLPSELTHSIYMYSGTSIQRTTRDQILIFLSFMCTEAEITLKYRKFIVLGQENMFFI